MTIRQSIAALNRQDTPAQIAERIAYRAAATQARAEARQAYPVLTAENFDEAAAFQERRIRELVRERG